MSTDKLAPTAHVGTRRPVPTAPPKSLERARRRPRVYGVMDSDTIRKLNQYLGIDSGDLLTDNTWKALGKLLKLSGPFSHSNRHNRALQRHIKMPYGLVTGKWFDTETKTFDRATTLRLQQFLEKALP